jgi:hypothetical protein
MQPRFRPAPPPPPDPPASKREIAGVDVPTLGLEQGDPGLLEDDSHVVAGQPDTQVTEIATQPVAIDASLQEVAVCVASA